MVVVFAIVVYSGGTLLVAPHIENRYKDVCKIKAEALHLSEWTYNQASGCIVYYKGTYTDINNVGKYR